MVLKATPDEFSSEGAESGSASTAATRTSEGLRQAQLQHALSVLRHEVNKAQRLLLELDQARTADRICQLGAGP